MEYISKMQKWSNQFAWNLARLCSEKNISMEKLFVDIGLSVREKNRILKGHNPTLHKICRIAQGLKIDPSVLLDFSKEKTTPFKYIFSIPKRLR